MSSVVLLALLAALGPIVVVAMSRHQLELKDHYEHINKIMEFGCDLPQPRLLNVHELFSDSQTQGKAFFPEVTLLHRCDQHVGSCDSVTYQCGPTDSSEISLPFMVTFLEVMGDHARGESVIEYYPLLNHTACGCLKNTLRSQGFRKNTSYVPVVDTTSEMEPSSYNVTQASGDVQTKLDGSASKPGLVTEQNSGETDKEAKQKPGSTECQNQYFQATSKTTPTALSTSETNVDEITIIPEESIRFGEDDNRLAKPQSESNTVEPLSYETKSESSKIDLSKFNIFKGSLFN